MLKSRWQMIALGAIALVLVVVGCTALLRKPASDSAAPPSLTGPIAGTSLHLKLGNPSNATTEVANANNYLLVKPQYAVSYNNSKHIPNWASWQLNQSWLGTLPRRNDFRPDPSLPRGWYQVKSADYNGSGYDRGHMTPSADRDNTPENMSSTYFMTNILPQSPDNNQGPWANLEQYSRDLTKQGKELYIVAGGYGEKSAIGSGAIKIVPPARTWKVIVVLEKPGAAVTNNTRVIAIDMPNEQGIKEADWRKFRVSVDQIEQKTGYNFLTSVPEDVQNAIESKVDKG